MSSGVWKWCLKGIVVTELPIAAIVTTVLLASQSVPRCCELRIASVCRHGLPYAIMPTLFEEESSLAHVTLRDGEDGESLLKRFQTTMQRSGILRELRNRRYFRTKGEQTRLDKARSLRRLRRRAQRR